MRSMASKTRIKTLGNAVTLEGIAQTLNDHAASLELRAEQMRNAARHLERIACDLRGPITDADIPIPTAADL